MIQLKEVDFAYKKRVSVFEKLSLDMEPGHIYGLLGKNGEGKTTLLNVLSGQLFPQSGECRVMDYNPRERDVEFLQQIFILPEEVSLPDVTIVEYGRMYAPFYPNFSKETWDTCIESFEIDTRIRLSKMSLGQRKKAAITLALAVHTPLLLMDEPTNGLDIPSKAVFRRLVASCMDEEQAIVISTHQVRDLESMIDSVLILEKKKILLNSSLENVTKHLFFRVVNADDKVLFSEPSPMGVVGVGENLQNEETPVSLELLFQAVTEHPWEINRIFTR